jgi:hypothetical protein
LREVQFLAENCYPGFVSEQYFDKSFSSNMGDDGLVQKPVRKGGRGR